MFYVFRPLSPSGTLHKGDGPLANDRETDQNWRRVCRCTSY
jgi:hypothetical protein